MVRTKGGGTESPVIPIREELVDRRIRPTKEGEKSETPKHHVYGDK